MRAFVANGLADSTVQTVAVPKVGNGEILVKVRAVALNPTGQYSLHCSALDQQHLLVLPTNY